MFSLDCLDPFGVTAVEVLVRLTILSSCTLLSFGYRYWVMCFKLFLVLIGISLSYPCIYLF